MDLPLGPCIVKKSRINILFEAHHHQFGVLSTDGNAVLLSTAETKDGSEEASPANVLAKYQRVYSMQWSNSGKTVNDSSLQTYISVVHDGMISIHQVVQFVPKILSLNMDAGSTHAQLLGAMLKINAAAVNTYTSFGCLWHPITDALCVVTKDSAFIHYDHSRSKRSYALPSPEHDHYSCGCWSFDGSKLLLCHGNSLQVLSWEGFDVHTKDFKDCSHKISGAEGNVLNISAVDASRYVCVVDVPLKRLCTAEQVDLFKFSAPDQLDENLSVIGDTVLTPNNKREPSYAEKLLAIKQNKHAEQCYAMILLFEIIAADLSINVLCSITIDGMVSPDLLLSQSSTGSVVVGSNSLNTIQVFQLKMDKLVKATEIVLHEKERPLGLCHASKMNTKQADTTLLLAVSKLTSTDSVFPSSSVYEKREITLRQICLPVSFNDNEGKAWSSSKHVSASVAETPSSGRSVSPEFKLLLPNSQRPIMHSYSKPKIVQMDDAVVLSNDVEKVAMSQLSSACSFPVYNNCQGQQSSVVNGQHLSVINGQQSSEVKGQQLSMANPDSTCELAALHSLIRRQSEEISEVKKQLENLRMGTEIKSSQESQYTPVHNAALVTLVYQQAGSQDQKMSFLLDNKRLRLETVLQAFGITTLQIRIGGVPCTVGSNRDGYIPLLFEENSEVFISSLR